MANEDQKDFNAMLADNKDMPKFPTMKSLDKYKPVFMRVSE